MPTTLTKDLIDVPSQTPPSTNDATDHSDARLMHATLGESARQQESQGWNKSAEHSSLHQLLEQQAIRTPNQTALAFEGVCLTYAELNHRANLLAYQLHKLGVRPEVRVGLLVDRSLEMIVAIFGILKAGGAYVPIDTASPAERARFMMVDSGMALLVTQRKPPVSVLPNSLAILALDSFDWNAAPEKPLIDTRSQSENLAYVIYTSGSTGSPKGVGVEHRNIVSYVLGISARLGFEPGMNHAIVSTIAADLGNTVLFPAIATGGCLHIIAEARAQNPASLSEYFEREEIDVLKITPSHLAALQAGRNPERMMPRQRLILGGEASRLEWISQLRRLAPDCEIYNHYGPTETTVGVLTYRVGTDIPNTPSGTLPLGKPLANCKVYILDSQKQRALLGVEGEIYVGGAGVARGYLNHDDLTEERFIPDPFSPRDGERLYRTGDRGRYLPSGDIEFLGRVDHQVKIRGYRVELGEIENTLRAHPGVHDAVAIASKDPGEIAAQLAAFVVPKHAFQLTGDKILTPEVLRKHLRERLPEYMVPSTFKLLEKLPLSANGKIDRTTLLSSSIEVQPPATGYLAPSDPIERALAQVWARILKVPRVGRKNNFFDLGGHSLLAMRVIGEVEKLFRIRLPLAVLFEAPTIAEFANLLTKQRRSSTLSSLVPIRPDGSRHPLFLMHSHGGNTLEYRPLAELLAPDQPVYALQARGLDGKLVPNTSVEEMASFYVSELRTAQPEGPYFLGGYCFGGMLAVEVARQLTAVGEKVALVVLIHPLPPHAQRSIQRVRLPQRLWDRSLNRISLQLEHLSCRGLSYIGEQLRFDWHRIQARAAMSMGRVNPQRNNDLSHLPLHYIFKALEIEHDKAADKYVPRPYEGNVLLFRAEKQMRRSLVPSPLLGWEGVLKGHVDLYEINCHQQNLLHAPNISMLADGLNNHLATAQNDLNDRAEGQTAHETIERRQQPIYI